jgi:hypothetical protein
MMCAKQAAPATPVSAIWDHGPVHEKGSADACARLNAVYADLLILRLVADLRKQTTGLAGEQPLCNRA